MKKTITTIFLLFIILGSLFLGSGCESYQYPVKDEINVLLMNKSDQEVHMWVSGTVEGKEKISSENKLKAGEQRLVKLWGLWPNDGTRLSVIAFAGKNGQIITYMEVTSLWTEIETGTPLYFTFDGSNKLKYNGRPRPVE